ncbi:MAG: site-specific integrase [Chloroflexota bacterium]
MRRGRHEGGITKRLDRNNKVIGYQVQVRLPGGQRKTLGTVPTMREARLLAQQGQVDLASGRLSENKRQKLDEYLRAWIASKKPGLAPSTHDSYDLNRRRLEPYCGSVRLDVLRPKDIQQAYAGLTAQGLKPKSVRQAHRLLHAALQDAVRLGLVPMNVVDSTSPPRDQLNEMKTLTAPQLIILFRESRDDPLHALWVVLATTGLRLGEALGLRWGDIDLDAGRLSVQRALQRQSGGAGLVFTTPKTAQSRRTVDLTTVAIKALKGHRVRWEDRRDKLGDKWQGSDVVFVSDVGKLLDPTGMAERLGRILARAQLPRIRVHDLRHTAATLALQQGVSPKVVQEMLGHSSITLTLGTYSHVLPPMRREAADRMNALFDEPDPEP